MNIYNKLTIICLLIFSTNDIHSQSLQKFLDSDEIMEITVPEDENGVLNGEGEIFWYSGDKYEGNIKNGLFEGFGELTWFSGEKYKGNWVNDMKHGHGEMTWSDGTSYIGNWKEDKMHGIGTLSYSNGKSRKGEFKDGVWFKGL